MICPLCNACDCYGCREDHRKDCPKLTRSRFVMTDNTPKQLSACCHADVYPPSPLMLINGNDSDTCSQCFKPCELENAPNNTPEAEYDLLRRFTVVTRPYPNLYALLAVHYADHPRFGINPIKQLMELLSPSSKNPVITDVRKNPEVLIPSNSTELESPVGDEELLNEFIDAVRRSIDSNYLGEWLGTIIRHYVHKLVAQERAMLLDKFETIIGRDDKPYVKGGPLVSCNGLRDQQRKQLNTLRSSETREVSSTYGNNE